MEPILVVLGLVIVLAMILDVVRTTVTVDSGSGWVSGLLAALVVDDGYRWDVERS